MYYKILWTNTTLFQQYDNKQLNINKFLLEMIYVNMWFTMSDHHDFIFRNYILWYGINIQHWAIWYDVSIRNYQDYLCIKWSSV